MYKGNSIVTDIHFIHFELSFQTKAHHLNVYLCYVRKVQHWSWIRDQKTNVTNIFRQMLKSYTTHVSVQIPVNF